MLTVHMHQFHINKLISFPVIEKLICRKDELLGYVTRDFYLLDVTF